MENPSLERIGYVRHSGIELTSVSADRATGRIEVTEIHHQPYGLVHGGVYCAFIETLASESAALWAIEQGMAGAVGVSNQTDFIKATAGGTLIGEATPIHRGRTQQLWRVVVTRTEDGKVAAQGQVRLQNVSDTEAF